MHRAVLITGGAGYVGSHISWLLAQHGYQVIVIDNFHHKQQVSLPWATIIKEDFAHKETLTHIFNSYAITAVIHCAAFIEVHQSIKDPKDYYENNVFKTAQLLEAMLIHGIKRFIFSSSCAVYGVPQHIPISEEYPRCPISPYGATKYMVEQMLADYAHAYGMQFVSLRYFNAAGAQPDDNLGEQHTPETHIIPLLLHAMMAQKPFTLFGDDYDTPDGSCIRDFLHVADIAQAHLLALNYLEKNGASDFFNLGTGQGISIKQLVSTAEQLFNMPINLIIAQRRAGDPQRLVADPSKAELMLGWKPQHSDITYILRSAYDYMLKQQSSSMQYKIHNGPTITTHQ